MPPRTPVRMPVRMPKHMSVRSPPLTDGRRTQVVYRLPIGIADGVPGVRVSVRRCFC